MNKFSALIAALQAGQQLSNSSTWKNRQNITNATQALLGAIVVLLPIFGIRLDLSNESVATLAGAVGVLCGLFNTWATTATTEKVGLPPRHRPGPPADDPAGQSAAAEPSPAPRQLPPQPSPWPDGTDTGTPFGDTWRG